MAEIPEPGKFFVEASPYEQYSIDRNNVIKYLSIEFYSDILDAYCVECKRDSTFKVLTPTTPLQSTGDPQFPSQGKAVRSIETMQPHTRYFFLLKNSRHYPLTSIDYAKRPNLFCKMFSCVRDDQHQMIFYVRSTGDKFEKIGQYPSLRDLHLPELERYKPVLGNENFIELRTGIGLHSHGVGIGAFVYLRRIVENLIEKAHLAAKKTPEFDDENYTSLRMSEKIKRLQGYLPDFLVDNRKVYGILSKGVHELSEEECRDKFPVLLSTVELILQDELRKQEIEKKKNETKQLLDKFADEINQE